MAALGGGLSAVIEQTWYYDRVDSALLDAWLRDIRLLEERPDSAKLQLQAPAGSGPPLPAAVGEGEGEGAACGDVGETGDDLSARLSGDLLYSIFSRLPVESLPRVSGVCHRWRHIVRDGNLWAQSFMLMWKLSEVEGVPTSSSFWRGKLSQFAISHELTRMDTIASLAVKYNVQVMDIRRSIGLLSAAMNDHGIYSRKRILIPVTKPEFLEGKKCFIEMDVHAKREVAVVYPDECRRDAEVLEANARDQAMSVRRMKEKVVESLKRSLQIDDGTASFYLTLAGGDVRQAYTECLEDLRWERRHKSGVRNPHSS